MGPPPRKVKRITIDLQKRKNPHIGQYQIRIHPRYKAQLALMEGIRKLEGASDISKMNVVEEALDLYYNTLTARNAAKMKELGVC
jgi:hypothetical protein